MRMQIRRQPQQLHMVPLYQLLYILRDLIPMCLVLIPAVGVGNQVGVEGRPVLDAQLGAEVEQRLDVSLVVL